MVRERPERLAPAKAVAVAGLIVALAVVALAAFHDGIPRFWSDQVEETVEYLRSLGPWTALFSIVLLVIETAVAPIPAAPLLAANAAIFGLWGGMFVSWCGGVLGAVVTFWIARSLGRSWVSARLKPEYRRLVERISQEQGFKILLLARLLPITSLDVLGYAAGLSAISFGKYLLASALGLAPGVALYTFFAHDLLRAQEYAWRLGAWVLAAVVVAAVARRLWRSSQRREPGDARTGAAKSETKDERDHKK